MTESRKTVNPMPECCSERTKVRSPEEERALINRLNRIEGQVRGVSTMVKENAYCIDILNQVAAISSALSGFARELLDSHVRSCVAHDIREGGEVSERSVDELMAVIARLVK